MRLLYFYIKNYRLLKDKSLNFDSWHRFEYEAGCLSCVRDVSTEAKDFFSFPGLGLGVVDSVSAIIGDNGSGKTTIARAIACLIRGNPELGDFVAVLSLRTIGESKKEHLEVYYRLDGVDELKFVNFNCPDEYKYNMGDVNVSFSLNQKLRLVYYSPLFTTERTMPMVANSFVSEPSCAVGGDDFQVSQRTAIAVRDVSMSSFVSSVLSEVGRASPENAIILSERKRLLQFLCDISHYPNLEKALDLHFNPTENHAIIVFDQELWDSRVSRLGKECKVYPHGLMETFTGDDAWIQSFVDLNPVCLSSVSMKIFFFFALEYLTSTYATVSEFSSDFTEAANELIRIVLLAAALGEKAKITKTEEALILDEIEKKEHLDHRFAALARLMRLSQAYTSHSEYDDRQTAFSFMQIELRNRDAQVIKDYLEMMDYYLACRGETDFLHFTFEKAPSAGEALALSMWARLQTAFRDSAEGKGEFRDIVLFMDEAETSMHPSWQRTIVERMVKMWQTLASGCNVHIIFGSHSPVLLSDIPADNVIWLQQDAEEVLKNEGFNTFGANIFDLYRLAFNQKNGTTGAFASAKIKEALSDAAGVVKSKIACRGTSELPRQLSNTSRLTLSLVGDDIIKKYIESLKDSELL